MKGQHAPGDGLSVQGRFPLRYRSLGRTGIEQAGAEPVVEPFRPGAEHGIAAVESDAVRTALVDVHLGRHSVFAKREIETHRVLRRDGRVLVGLEEEGRRCLGGHVLFGRHLVGPGGVFGAVRTEQVLARTSVSDFRVHRDHRIAENGEVGTGADLVDCIDRIVGGLVVEGGRHAREMASGGKAHHRDAGRIESQLRSTRSRGADRTLHVGKLCRVVVAGRSEPEVEDKSGDAAFVEPLRRLVPFVVGGESTIAATRADHDRGADVVFGSLGRVGVQGR